MCNQQDSINQPNNEFFKKLSIDNLSSILDCESLKKLKAILKNLKISEEVIDREIKLASEQIDKQYHFPRVRQAVINPITEATGVPLLISSVFFGLKQLGTIALSGILGGAAFIAFLAGGTFFYSTYKDLNKNLKKDNNEIILALIKRNSALELSERIKNNVDYIKNEAVKSNIQELKQYNLNALPKIENNSSAIKSGINTALQVGGVLFSIFYFGVGGFLTALGMAAIASNPIILGAAVGVSIGIGLYLGYQNFKMHKKTKQMNKTKNEIKKLTNNAQILKTFLPNSVSLVPVTQNLANMNASSDTDQTNMQPTPNPMLMVQATAISEQTRLEPQSGSRPTK